MAISKGQQSTEAAERKLFIGVGAVKVLAVNPTKAELEKIYNRTIDKEPEYVTEAEINGKKIPSVRISFIVKTDADKNMGIETITTHTYFLRKQYNQGSQSGKYQIMDIYGRTAWGTKEEIRQKNVPMYSNGPASIDTDYRLTYVGEEALTLFIKNLLNIPNVQSYVDGQWVDNPRVNKQDCLVRLDDIENYFKGDFKELREIITYQPNNLVKIAFGVRTADDGRMYQSTYDRLCFKNGVTDYSRLDTEIQNRKNSGGLSNVEYESGILHEYSLNPTPVASVQTESKNESEDLPW